MDFKYMHNSLKSYTKLDTVLVEIIWEILG